MCLLYELVSVYVQLARQIVSESGQLKPRIPRDEVRVVFGMIESIQMLHRDFLPPALASVIQRLLNSSGAMEQQGDDSQASTQVAAKVGEIFRTYAPYLKQYAIHINGHEGARQQVLLWRSGASERVASVTTGRNGFRSPGQSPSALPWPKTPRGRTTKSDNIASFLEQCRQHPQHSQIDLESYLILPVQRLPRYRLLLDNLASFTPLQRDSSQECDPIGITVQAITRLLSQANESTRDAESRMRLVYWQQRIKSIEPLRLVQPHRQYLSEGSLRLVYVTRLRKTVSKGRKRVGPIAVDVPDRRKVDFRVILVLCSDMLLLLKQVAGNKPQHRHTVVAIIRFSAQQGPRLATISPSNPQHLRLVGGGAVYYLDAMSHDRAAGWSRTIEGERDVQRAGSSSLGLPQSTL